MRELLTRETIDAMRTAILLFCLAACGPRVVSSTPRSVTLNGVTQMTIGDATTKAQAHCEGYGRDAELVPDAHQDGTATFRCVDNEGDRRSPTITADEERKRQRLERQLAASESRSTPRGFFCASSSSNSSAGFCVREKAECQRTRDAALAGLPDLGDCTLTERAFCFGDRCAPDAEACDAMRARALGPDGTGRPCEDSE